MIFLWFTWISYVFKRVCLASAAELEVEEWPQTTFSTRVTVLRAPTSHSFWNGFAKHFSSIRPIGHDIDAAIVQLLWHHNSGHSRCCCLPRWSSVAHPSASGACLVGILPPSTPRTYIIGHFQVWPTCFANFPPRGRSMVINLAM